MVIPILVEEMTAIPLTELTLTVVLYDTTDHTDSRLLDLKPAMMDSFRSAVDKLAHLGKTFKLKLAYDQYTRFHEDLAGPNWTATYPFRPRVFSVEDDVPLSSWKVDH